MIIIPTPGTNNNNQSMNHRYSSSRNTSSYSDASISDTDEDLYFIKRTYGVVVKTFKNTQNTKNVRVSTLAWRKTQLTSKTGADECDVVFEVCDKDVLEMQANMSILPGELVEFQLQKNSIPKRLGHEYPFRAINVQLARFHCGTLELRAVAAAKETDHTSSVASTTTISTTSTPSSAKIWVVQGDDGVTYPVGSDNEIPALEALIQFRDPMFEHGTRVTFFIEIAEGVGEEVGDEYRAVMISPIVTGTMKDFRINENQQVKQAYGFVKWCYSLQSNDLFLGVRRSSQVDIAHDLSNIKGAELSFNPVRSLAYERPTAVNTYFKLIVNANEYDDENGLLILTYTLGVNGQEGTLNLPIFSLPEGIDAEALSKEKFAKLYVRYFFTINVVMCDYLLVRGRISQIEKRNRLLYLSIPCLPSPCSVSYDRVQRASDADMVMDKEVTVVISLNEALNRATVRHVLIPTQGASGEIVDMTNSANQRISRIRVQSGHSFSIAADEFQNRPALATGAVKFDLVLDTQARALMACNIKDSDEPAIPSLTTSATKGKQQQVKQQASESTSSNGSNGSGSVSSANNNSSITGLTTMPSMPLQPVGIAHPVAQSSNGSDASTSKFLQDFISMLNANNTISQLEKSKMTYTLAQQLFPSQPMQMPPQMSSMFGEPMGMQYQQPNPFASPEPLSPFRPRSFSMARMHRVPYKIEDLEIDTTEKLGSGVFSVYSGWYSSAHFDRIKVAVKVLPRSQVAQEHVLKEREILRKLANHKHIVNCHGDKSDDENYYFIMEYCPVDFASRIKVLENKERLRIVQEVVQALESVHLKSILHADLKPGNILLTREVEVKLADFGLSKVLKSDKRSIHSDRSGTSGWCAKEILQGSKHTKESDMFSLGLVIFHILSSGDHAFQDETNTDTSLDQNILQNNWLGLAKWKKRLEDAFPGSYSLIKGMLEPTPDKRLTIQAVKQHPLLWTMDQKAKYLVRLNEMLKDKGATQLYTEMTQWYSSCEDMMRPYPVGTDWRKMLPKELVDEINADIKKFSKSQYESIDTKHRNEVPSLVHLIRNVHTHYREGRSEVEMSGFGEHGVEVLLESFPKLISFTYVVVGEYLKKIEAETKKCKELLAAWS